MGNIITGAKKSVTQLVEKYESHGLPHVSVKTSEQTITEIPVQFYDNQPIINGLIRNARTQETPTDKTPTDKTPTLSEKFLHSVFGLQQKIDKNLKPLTKAQKSLPLEAYRRKLVTAPDDKKYIKKPRTPHEKPSSLFTVKNLCYMGMGASFAGMLYTAWYDI